MGVARLSTRLALWRGGGSLLGEALRRAGPALGEEPALLGWLGSPSAAQLASLSQARWLSTGAAPPTLDEGQAAELAKALRSQQLLDALEPLRAITSAVPHHKLLEIAQQQGLAPAAAEDAIGRLERAGALINLAGTVVLRPGEVAAALNLLLPTSTSHTEQRLEEVQRELQAMREQEAAIGRRAAWRQRGIIWGGLAGQGALWALLFRLTYWELSWDVMEPVCFFVGGGQAMLAYCYFMLTRRDFSWEGALHRHVGRWERGALAAAGFDAQRYARLQGEAARLADLLAAQRSAAADSKKQA